MSLYTEVCLTYDLKKRILYFLSFIKIHKIMYYPLSILIKTNFTLINKKLDNVILKNDKHYPL